MIVASLPHASSAARRTSSQAPPDVGFAPAAGEARRLTRGRTGVYALWLPAETGAGYECIYVGMSHACIRQRLLQHLQHETNPDLARQLRLFPNHVKFSAAFTQGHEETLDLETAVIQAWQPSTNRNKLG